MEYKELGKKYKTYVVQRTTGFGEQGGAPVEYHEYVDSFKYREDAMVFGHKKFPNESLLTYESFTILINTSTKDGKEEYRKFELKMAASEKHYRDHPELYTIVDMPNSRWRILKNHIWDQTPEVKDYPLESYKFVLVDIS